MLKIANFIKVKNLAEAYALNQERTNVVLGGMMWLKLGSRSVQTAIDLSGLGLDGIEETAEEFRIGCMCTLRDLELHAGLQREFQGVVREAVHHIVGVQFRNAATVGGSIYGRFGFSDLLTCFLVLDSYVELYKGGIIPLQEFAQSKPDQDILVRLIIKKDGRQVSYQSQRKAKTDFPLITVAMAQKAEQFYVAIGARPGKAALVEKTDPALAEQPSEQAISAFAEWASGQFNYGSDLRAGAAYRQHLAGVYVQRALKAVLGGEQE